MTPNFKELREELEWYIEGAKLGCGAHEHMIAQVVLRCEADILAALAIAERGQWVKTSGAWGYFYNCCSDHRVLAVFDTEELASKSHKEDCKPWDDKSPVFFIAEPLPPEEK